MPTKYRRSIRGFSLIELLVAMAITIIVLGAALMMFKKSMEASVMVALRAEMQSNARVAINSIVRDLNRAGSGGMPFGGIALANNNAIFAPGVGGINNLAPNSYTRGGGILYMVTPSPQAGPTLNGNPNPTDGITVAYVDPTLNWGGAFTACVITNNGNTVTMPTGPAGANCAPPNPPGVNPAINNVAAPVQIGDVFMLSNSNTPAGVAACVTAVNPNTGAISFANGDLLGMNNTGFANGLPIPGSIASLQNQPLTAPATYPPVTMQRLTVVTYFIQPLNNAGNPLDVTQGGNAADFRLMRQINAQAPVPIAEHIQALNFSYDLTNLSNVPAADTPPGTPVYNSIRSVYVAVTARSSRRNQFGQYYTTTMFTNESPRNLSFRDRFN